jgi:RNA polymerase sigma-70 factor (ECF subfamily)
MSITTSKTLIARLKDNNDQDAWDRFFQLYSPLIIGFARRRQCTLEMSHDVLQETMMCLMKLFPKFEYDPNKGRFSAFMFTIVSARINDAFRRQCRYQSLNSNEESSNGMEYITDFRIKEAGAEWDELWEQNLLIRAMESIKQRVNPITWRSFELYVLEEHSIAAIAKILNINANTIYQHKNRITRLLREEIEYNREELGDYKT